MKIVLCGFYEEQKKELENSFKKVSFISDFREPLNKINPNALIGITRSSIQDLFLKDKIIKCKKLKWIHLPGAGVEEFMFQGIDKCNFIITNGKIIQGPEVSDHAIALLLMLTRRIHYYLDGLNHSEIPYPIELNQKKALIIGSGGIGHLAAEKLSAFGVEVSVITNDLIPLSNSIKKVYNPIDISKAIKDKDFVIMTAPLTRRSQKLINKELLNKFKKGSYFVNVSRGKTVCTDAICYGLEKKILKAVALDVTDPEPLPKNHRIYSFPNAIITPHIAGMSDLLKFRSWDLITNNINRFINEEKLLNIVDKKEGY